MQTYKYSAGATPFPVKIDIIPSPFLQSCTIAGGTMKRSQDRVYEHRRSVSAIKNRACVYVKSFNVSLFTVARYTLIFPQQIRLLFFRPSPATYLRCKSPPATTRSPLYIRDISYAGRSHGKNANFHCRPHDRLPLPTIPLTPQCFAHPRPVWWPDGIALFITEYLIHLFSTRITGRSEKEGRRERMERVKRLKGRHASAIVYK